MQAAVGEFQAVRRGRVRLSAMISPAALRRRPAPIDRAADRTVALAAIGLAVGFLVAALLATLLPASVRRGAWLPLHLGVAGGATTAIAGVMPFFSAAFAAAPPIDARLRSAAVAGVSLGALAVALAVVGGQPGVAAAGGVVFLAGIALTGLATVRPLGRGLGPGRGLITRAYVVALCEVAVGASVAIVFLAGWPPLVEDWGQARPAHAWLNLFGFVSLVIATTLLHFFPTVVGARIAVRPSAWATVAGLAAGAPVVALGIALQSDLIARVGAACVLVGAVGLAAYAARTWQTRARWTTDPDWHRFAIVGLVSAIAWFEIASAIAAGRVLVSGSGPTSWSLEAVAGPLLAGWVGLAVIASATHLVPAVGPGDPPAHARQRALLGRFATPRLVVTNVGVAVLAVGLPLHLEALVTAGVALLATGLGLSAILLASAMRIGIHRRP